MKAEAGKRQAVDGRDKDKIESILNTLNQPPSTTFRAKLKLKFGGSTTPATSSNSSNKVAEAKVADQEDEPTQTQSLNLPLPINPNYKLLDILEEFKLTDKDGSKVPKSASYSDSESRREADSEAKEQPLTERANPGKGPTTIASIISGK